MVLWLFAICATICLFGTALAWVFLFVGPLQLSLGCALAAFTSFILAGIALDNWRNS